MVYRTTERGAKVRAATQARILRAAGKLFAAHGYEATTMQDIVKEAKTSIGNVYFYFANKEALVRALLESSFVEMFDASEQRVARIRDGAERVGTLIAINTTTLLTTRSGMLDILAADSRLGVVQQLGDLAIERWNRILRDAFPDRDPNDLALAAAAIWGTNRSIVERTVRGAFTTDTKSTVTFAVGWTLRALDVERTRTERIASSGWRVAVRHARTLEAQPW